jgi:hypothetical protein
VDVAEAEEKLATLWRRKTLASSSLKCGEPQLDSEVEPNTDLSMHGEPQLRRGERWPATKHTLYSASLATMFLPDAPLLSLVSQHRQQGTLWVVEGLFGRKS